MHAIGGPVEGRNGYGGEGCAGSAHRLDRSAGGAAVRVVLSGEIDRDSAGVVEDLLMAAIEGRAAFSVVVDLGTLRFMDAKCAGVLLEARCRADQLGVAMGVTRVNGIPRRVLEILGLYDELVNSSGYASPPKAP